MSTASQTNGSAVHDIKSAAGKADSAVRQEFQKFVTDLEDMIESTSEWTGEELSQARHKLGERIASAKDSIQSVSGEVASRAKHSARVTDEYVHEQPWKSIAAGAGIGFLLGMLVSRSS